MNDNEQFLKIIDKFIDSVGAINQNLGPVKDTLIHIVDKIDKQNTIHEGYKKQFEEFKISLDSARDQIEKMNEAVTLLKELFPKISGTSDLEMKKLELDTQIKVAEITQNSTTVREVSGKKWTFWGILIPAMIAALVGIVTMIVKPEEKKDNTEKRVIERVIEKR